MPKKNFSLVLLAAFLLPTLGCTTNVSGRQHKLSIASAPATGAEVTIDGRSQKTPAMFILDRNRPFYLVSIKQKGQSSEIYLQRNGSGWTFGNILFGGTLGFSVDTTTGSIHKFQPSHHEIDLAAQVLGITNLDGKDIIFVKVDEAQDS